MCCITIQGLVTELWPMNFEPVVLDLIDRAGSGVMALGAAILLLGYIPMMIKGTSIVDSRKHTTHIVTKGIFAYSRNPIYLGWLTIFFGLAMATLSWSGLLIPILMIALLDRFVIMEEEQYLESRFGDDYLSYKAQVRRWL